MFHVRDNRFARSRRITAFLTKEEDAGIAVILAFAHFEWTVARAILVLGKRGTAELREELRDCRGPDGYKKQWSKELVDHPPLPILIKRWNLLVKAWHYRGTLVHGIRPTRLAFARPQVNIVMDAANIILDFCEGRGVNLFTRLKSRRRKQ
jgi:hypothetical protein